MGIPTLQDFATDNMLTMLLVKERAKCRRRNRGDKHHRLDKECELNELTTRKMLSRIMPPRYSWVRPSKRSTLPNGAVDTSKNAEKALLLTIRRDRKRQKRGASIGYLDELDAFVCRIRRSLADDNLRFEPPRLMPILKDTDPLPDSTLQVTCRPLSVYSKLEDKIVLALTSRYLTRYFDRYLHENILSYRPARDFHGQKHYVTKFSDGVALIKDFRKIHNAETIYAADCDIKKFYDIIPHEVVRDCFRRLLERSSLNKEGKEQVMRVVEAYLSSYNFYTNAWLEAQNNPDVYYKVRRRLHDGEKQNTYQLGWVDKLKKNHDEQCLHRGVSQGGSLSLLVANIVLDDVDRAIVETQDENRLFIRYCDDMILLHTDKDECRRLMERYEQSLREHGLYYHDFESVCDSKCRASESGTASATTKHFWKIKSHRPFLWGEGPGDSNLYIGFLGYEIRRDGRMRLRKSNVMRFDDKFKRLRYALMRYRKKHTEEQYREHQKKVLDNVVGGVEFYEAFDMRQFKAGSQYRYILKLRKRMEKHLQEK